MMGNTEIVFTKHARERIKLRAMTEDMVIQAINDPDKSFSEADGGRKFIRKINGRKVHAVCKLIPEENKWLVKSTWVRGEDNNGNPVPYYKGYGKRYDRSQDNDLANTLYLFLFILLAIIFLLVVVFIVTGQSPEVFLANFLE